MYEIYVDDLLIHSDVTPSETHKVLEPKLTMEDSAAGSLEFAIPPGNVGYNSIQKLTSDIIVYEDGEEIWRGRCISENVDFWKNKRYVIEGALAFLNDSIQPPREFNVSNTTIRSFLEVLIANHNNQVAENRRFKVGMVTVDDGDSVDDDGAIRRYTNYETTLACINDKLIDKLKGHVYIKREFDASDNTYKFTINYVKDYLEIVDKEIRFGKNLLDYAQSYEVTDLATVIVPRGSRLDESPIEGLEAYTTVASCGNDGDWHKSGSIFVTNKPAVENYGFICAVVDWDNVDVPNNLLTKAKKYLQELQWNKLTLEVSVLDLHYLNVSEPTFKLLQQVRCISEPHGMDAVFPITRMEIDLTNPANTTFSLGTEVTPTLTSATNKVDFDLLNYLNNTPSESAMLRSAKENARALVTGTMDGGYAGFIYGSDEHGNAIVDPETGKLLNPDRPTGFRVADALTDETALHRWIWTYGGLMHQYRPDISQPWSDTLPNAAMTMDGKIVANYITAGTMSCDRLNGGEINGQTIRGGYIYGTTLSGARGSITDGTGTLYLESGNLHMAKNTTDGAGLFARGSNSVYSCWGARRSGAVSAGGGEYVDTTTYNIVLAGRNVSDERLKNDIKDIDTDFAKKLILDIKPKEFKFKDIPDTLQFGVIAQDVKRIEESCGITEKNRLFYEEEDGTYAVEYRQLIAPMIKVIQEQQKEIDELKKAISNLQNE